MSNPTKHQCARSLFDGVECDLPEHASVGCPGCTPYVHADGTLDHEPSCSDIVVTVTLEKDHV